MISYNEQVNFLMVLPFVFFIISGLFIFVFKFEYIVAIALIPILVTIMIVIVLRLPEPVTDTINDKKEKDCNNE